MPEYFLRLNCNTFCQIQGDCINDHFLLKSVRRHLLPTLSHLLDIMNSFRSLWTWLTRNYVLFLFPCLLKKGSIVVGHLFKYKFTICIFLFWNMPFNFLSSLCSVSTLKNLYPAPSAWHTVRPSLLLNNYVFIRQICNIFLSTETSTLTPPGGNSWLQYLSTGGQSCSGHPSLLPIPTLIILKQIPGILWNFLGFFVIQGFWRCYKVPVVPPVSHVSFTL